MPLHGYSAAWRMVRQWMPLRDYSAAWRMVRHCMPLRGYSAALRNGETMHMKIFWCLLIDLTVMNTNETKLSDT